MNINLRRACAWLLLIMTAVMLAGCRSTAVVPELSGPMDAGQSGSGDQLPQKLPPERESVPGKTCPLPLDDWRIRLVNWEHPVDREPEPEMTVVRSGIYVDSRCYGDLMEMLNACQAEGLIPIVCSGYRDIEYQTELFEKKVRKLRAEGMSEQEAYESARTIVALPGTSEHHLGLAVDIVDWSYQQLNELQEETAVQKWLLEHCWEYGFILRYPNGKSDITGIIYEPWHYRYVGREVAAEIRDFGLCMEEYLAQFGVE